MITFVIEGNDQNIIRYYWKPFEAKYSKYQYSFVDESQANKAITNASHKTVFVTDIDAVPTYETVVLLESIIGKNEVLLPKWYSGYGNPTKELNAFSVLRENFVSVGHNLDEHIKKWTPKVHKKGSIYYVGT